MKKLPLLTLLLGISSFTPIPPCSTFVVENSSSSGIGYVAIGGNGSTTFVNVSGIGTYTQEVCHASAYVIINGTQINYPNAGVAVVGANEVEVTWDNPSRIEIIDYTSTGR